MREIPMRQKGQQKKENKMKEKGKGKNRGKTEGKQRKKGKEREKENTTRTHTIMSERSELLLLHNKGKRGRPKPSPLSVRTKCSNARSRLARYRPWYLA